MNTMVFAILLMLATRSACKRPRSSVHPSHRAPPAARPPSVQGHTVPLLPPIPTPDSTLRRATSQSDPLEE
ncbi:hypothetical protein PENSPDRAFT_46061 [Peniophora sp. CONT]|nr:hypothetical protein PENSPDRAFT_46061 [Peniophora sp. CONT]